MDCEDGDFIGDSDDDDDFECDSDETDDTVTEDTADCYTSEVNDLGAPVRSSAFKQSTQDPNELREPVREFNALCYEDICLWVVRNPRRGDRDLLAMEVNLRHHKGVGNKPKPCVKLPQSSAQANRSLIGLPSFSESIRWLSSALSVTSWLEPSVMMRS